MKRRILTQTEKKRIEKYLQSGKGSDPIRVLRYRARKFLPTIENDISLLRKLLEASKRT